MKLNITENGFQFPTIFPWTFRVSKSWIWMYQAGIGNFGPFENPQGMHPRRAQKLFSSVPCLATMASLLEKDAAETDAGAAEVSAQGVVSSSTTVEANGNSTKDAVAAGSTVGTTKEAPSVPSGTASAAAAAAAAAPAAAADQVSPPTTGSSSSNNKKKNKKKKKKAGKEREETGTAAGEERSAGVGDGNRAVGAASADATLVDGGDAKARVDNGSGGAGGGVVHASSSPAGAAGGGTGGVDIGSAAAAAGAGAASNGADILRLLKKQQIESLVARGGKKEHK